MSRLEKRMDENVVSLNIETRQSELEEEKVRKEERNAEREERGPAFDVKAFEVTLDNVGDEELKLVDFDRKKERSLFAAEDPDEDAEEAAIVPDAIRNEALQIAADMVGNGGSDKTASVDGGKSKESLFRD